MAATTTDTCGFLATEARIIAEDARHVVIALRLDKRAIARNLPFLAALADLAPMPPQRRRRHTVTVAARSRRPRT